MRRDNSWRCPRDREGEKKPEALTMGATSCFAARLYVAFVAAVRQPAKLPLLQDSPNEDKPAARGVRFAEMDERKFPLHVLLGE